MAANPSSYYPEACVFNTEETYWVQRQSGWLYSLLRQGADQRWNKVWQVKMNSQCQNDEIKLLIFLFCLSVVSLLSIAVQWNNVVSTWRFSFILMQRSRDDGVSCLRFLVGDISFVTICTFWKLTLITLNSLWNNFGHVLMIEICSVLSGSGCWRMWYTIYENRPHRRHFTIHCLQWSITFLTEYMYKIRLQTSKVFLKLATNGQSDKAFLLTSELCPQRVVYPCPGAIYMWKNI